MPRPVIARIHSDHLRLNYQLLNNRAGRAQVMAVVKANAYGHGIDLIAPALYAAGCRCFGVTDATEGRQLRALLAEDNASEITLLSGIHDADDAHLCEMHQLTPAITEAGQLALLKQAGFNDAVWIKIDTGMNRLGALDAPTLTGKADQVGIAIRGIMSHLACADMPDHPLNRQQADTFAELCETIDPALPRSLLNSAGMVTMSDQVADVVRPGLALYGAEPVADRPLGIKPVMSMTAEVMQVRDIPAGAQISYGATFKALKPMRIAVVTAGYADGVPRLLSNCGSACWEGLRLPVVGRVCMDYTMVDVSDTAIQAGDIVEFWGEQIDVNQVAAQTGTISYTLFTGVGDRVRRIVEHSG